MELEASGSSVDELDAEVAELRDAARRAGVKVVEAGRGGSDRPKDRPSSSGSSSGSSSAGSSSGSSASSRSVPAEWQTWGTQVESNRIVAWASRGARFYANYHLDEEGGMTCLLLSPRGASVISAARQLWRYFTIEQYRLLILSRLPGAKSRYPTLAKLNARYESVAQAIRRMNKSEQDVETRNWFRRVGRRVAGFWKNDGKARYKVQQQFLETITDLEQSTAQELARAKSEATTAHAYHEIIQTRFEEADFRPLGGEVRFLPPLREKKARPGHQHHQLRRGARQILSDALERTTGLLQAGVEVRLQRLNEIITRLGLVFTVLSVVLGFFSAVAYEGPLQSILRPLQGRAREIPVDEPAHDHHAAPELMKPKKKKEGAREEYLLLRRSTDISHRSYPPSSFSTHRSSAPRLASRSPTYLLYMNPARDYLLHPPLPPELLLARLDAGRRSRSPVPHLIESALRALRLVLGELGEGLGGHRAHLRPRVPEPGRPERHRPERAPELVRAVRLPEPLARSRVRDDGGDENGGEPEKRPRPDGKHVEQIPKRRGRLGRLPPASRSRRSRR